tara:strand:- start:5269 stop:5550 length:282 start_codon:yes stop_codon:yes gene_type:complete
VKNRILFLLISNFLISCSHVEVSGYNRDQNTVTIETSGFATEADAQKEADKYCRKQSRLVSMDKRFVGTNVHKVGDSVTATNKTNLFFTFSCQ